MTESALRPMGERAALSFHEAIRRIVAPGAPAGLHPDLELALAIPLNAVCERLKGQPGLTRDRLVEEARQPYVEQLLAATGAAPAGLLLAADSLAVGFGAGRVVRDLARPGRLVLLPAAPSPPGAFVRLLNAILDGLPDLPDMPAKAARDDPSYA